MRANNKTDTTGSRSTRLDRTPHLMLDGLVEHVEGLSGTLVKELVEEEGEPGAEHLLRNALCAPEEELGVRLPLHATLDQVAQQRLQDVRAVLHPDHHFPM